MYGDDSTLFIVSQCIVLVSTVKLTFKSNPSTRLLCRWCRWTVSNGAMAPKSQMFSSGADGEQTRDGKKHPQV